MLKFLELQEQMKCPRSYYSELFSDDSNSNCFDDHKISSQRYILIHCCHTKNKLKHISACFRVKSVKMMYACSAEYSEELIKISQDALIFINPLEKCKHGLGSYILRKNWQKTKFYL